MIDDEASVDDEAPEFGPARDTIGVSCPGAHAHEVGAKGRRSTLEFGRTDRGIQSVEKTRQKTRKQSFRQF